MHILEIPSFFPPYGGLFCLDQAKALSQRGHEVRILSCMQLSVTVKTKYYFTLPISRQWLTMDGIDVYIKYMRGLPKFVKYNVKRICDISLSMFEDYVKAYGMPDVLHAHCCQWGGVVASIISEKYNIPFFVTEHLSAGLYEKHYGKEWERFTWAKPLLVNTYRKASCVIPVARELVPGTRHLFGDDYKWKEISNIIDTHFFAYKERNRGKVFRFCCIANGNEVHIKGYDVLAKAFESFNDAELHIVGQFTDTEAFRSLFRNTDNVIFHGETDKYGVRDILYQCDALVLASRSEVQPLVLLEAMSTGIPVVSTEVTPESERIHGACLIARTGDADSLREKMQEVMHIQPSKYISEKIERLASPEVVAKQLESLFLTLHNYIAYQF